MLEQQQPIKALRGVKGGLVDGAHNGPPHETGTVARTKTPAPPAEQCADAFLYNNLLLMQATLSACV